MEMLIGVTSEEEIKERISEVISKGGGPKFISDKTGISISTLNNYIAKSSCASFVNVIKISHATKVDIAWLAFGEKVDSIYSEEVALDVNRKVSVDIVGFRSRLRLIMGNESEAKFARRANISQSGLNRILNNGTPKLDLLCAIATASGVQIDWLITGVGPKYGADDIPCVPITNSIIDEDLMKKCYGCVTEIYNSNCIELNMESIFVDVVLLYNYLALKINDISDDEMVEAEMQPFIIRLRRRLLNLKPPVI